MPRNPVRSASSVSAGVRSSFHAVPYRKSGTDGRAAVIALFLHAASLRWLRGGPHSYGDIPLIPRDRGSCCVELRGSGKRERSTFHHAEQTVQHRRTIGVGTVLPRRSLSCANGL